MSVFVYVLRSLKSQVLYTGMTENLERRLVEHNQGKTRFTKGHLPWELVYKEEALDFVEHNKQCLQPRLRWGDIIYRLEFVLV